MSRKLFKHLVDGDILGLRARIKEEKKNPYQRRGRSNRRFKRKFKKR